MEAFNDIHFKFIHAQSCSYHFPFILIGPFSSHVPHHSMDWLQWFSHVFSWNIGDLEVQFPRNQWFKEKSTGNHWFSHVFLLKLWLVYSFTSPCFPPKPSIFPWNIGGVPVKFPSTYPITHGFSRPSGITLCTQQLQRLAPRPGSGHGTALKRTVEADLTTLQGWVSDGIMEVSLRYPE